MNNRRGFLRGLISLPLIGGGVTLIGQPTAVAVPASLPLLDRYAAWLAVEYGECIVERSGLRQPEHADHAMEWRREWCRENRTLNPKEDSGRFIAAPVTLPSSRAALVLSAVGYDWQEAGR